MWFIGHIYISIAVIPFFNMKHKIFYEKNDLASGIGQFLTRYWESVLYPSFPVEFTIIGL